MEIYITKPAHSEYGHGRIPINNRFSTIDELIENSKVWFNKPSLTKPFLDIFTDKFIFRGWHNYHLCYILVKDFPECQVKEFIKNKIRESVSDDFSETYKNKHYRWVYPINVKITSSEEPGNFDLYVKKPSSVHDIQYAGIDRFKIYLEDPKSPLFNDHTSYLLGRLFRKTLELEYFMHKIWNENIKSFDVEYDNDRGFLFNISKTNHFEGKGCDDFLLTLFANIQLS